MRSVSEYYYEQQQAEGRSSKVRAEEFNRHYLADMFTEEQDSQGVRTSTKYFEDDLENENREKDVRGTVRREELMVKAITKINKDIHGLHLERANTE